MKSEYSSKKKNEYNNIDQKKKEQYQEFIKKGVESNSIAKEKTKLLSKVRTQNLV